MKDFVVVFSPIAIDDADEAVAYYENVQAGLGKRFAVQLQISLNSIKRNPFFASVRYDGIRCAGIKKFPFLVHYHIDEKQQLVIILAVYSTYREPLG